MKRIIALSTVDNPYDPINDWDKWLVYDMQKGYDTCGILAKFSMQSDEFTDALQNALDEAVIDTIIASDAEGKYVKIVHENE